VRRATIALVLAATLSARPVRAADADPWLGQDKALHFAVSAGIAAGGYAAGAALFDGRGKALLFGGGLAAAAGIAKETADLAGLGDPSWRDLAWDGIGLVTGLAVAWGLDLLIRGVPEAGPALARVRTGIAF
jgi:putative lipoprotein